MLIVHTADVHLGAKLGFFEEAAGRQREQIRLAFSRIIDQAITKKADLFLVAGDIFDSNLPARATINFVLSEFERLITEQIHIAVIPGNHDNYAVTSVYRLTDWQKLNPEFFHLFTEPAVTAWEIPELDTVIYGAAVAHKKSSINQIKDFTPVVDDYTYKIGLFHGSVDILSQPDNYPLPVAELKKLPLNYVALGDWHGQLEISKAKPAVWYAGSPELLASDQEKSGKALLVEINSAGETRVEPIVTGVTQTMHLELNVADFTGTNEITKYILNETAKQSVNTVLQLRLQGTLKPEQELELEQLTQELKERFLVANVEDATVNPKFAVTDSADSLVVGRYLEYLDAKLAEDSESKTQVERARILGLRLLSEGETEWN